MLEQIKTFLFRETPLPTIVPNLQRLRLFLLEFRTVKSQGLHLNALIQAI